MHPEKREEWNFRKIENIKELENIFPKDRNKTFFQNTLEGGGMIQYRKASSQT